MICKNCGTESRENFCPRCGEMLRFVSVPPSAPLPVAPKADPPVKKESKEQLRARKKREKKKKRAALPVIPMRVLICPILTLLLPIVYLFFDAFVLLSERLFVEGGDPTPLRALVETLCDPLYANNSVQEIQEAWFGERFAFFSTLTPLSLFRMSGLGILCVPLILELALVFGCVLFALLLAITKGKILRVGFFSALIPFCGVGATFAPLLANALLQLVACVGRGVQGAELWMLRVTPSIEALCLMGLLACILLPSMHALRRVSADALREAQAVYFPWGFLKKTSSAVAKSVTLVAGALGVVLVLVMTLLPISRFATLRDIGELIRTDWAQIGNVWQSLRVEGGSPVALFETLLRLASLWWMPISLIAVICATVGLIRTVCLHKDETYTPKKLRFLGRMLHDVRGAVLAPYTCFVLVQSFLIAVLLFATPILKQLNFDDVTGVLSVLYLAIGYVCSLGGTGVLYICLALGGGVLWFTIDQGAAAVLVHALKRKEKKGDKT